MVVSLLSHGHIQLHGWCHCCRPSHHFQVSTFLHILWGFYEAYIFVFYCPAMTLTLWTSLVKGLDWRNSSFLTRCQSVDETLVGEKKQQRWQQVCDMFITHNIDLRNTVAPNSSPAIFLSLNLLMLVTQSTMPSFDGDHWPKMVTTGDVGPHFSPGCFRPSRLVVEDGTFCVHLAREADG